MLFNLDKQSKKNILENYRHEALISSLRKIEQKKKEKEEDKFNLEQKEMRQKEMLDMINKERIEKKENLKKEYNLMLQRTKGFLPKNNHLIVKNWGQKKEPLYLPALNSESYSFNNKNNEKKKSILNIKNNFNNLNQNQQEKEILKQVDHMNEFLTDEQNEKEVKQYFKIRKENRHHFYKDLLFSQYQEAINKNFNLYGTKDELILKQKKRKNLTDNPYKFNKGYDFGASSLNHNPIINPENNYNYNKYIDYQSYRLNPDKSRNNMIRNNLLKLKSMDNLIPNENKYKCNNDYFEVYNYNNINRWNNNLKQNHTIDIDYINKNKKTPFEISTYKFNIINKKYNNERNGAFIKRNLSQNNMYINQI